MRIYLQDLEKYNNGCSLCGEWIDLSQIDEDELKEKINHLIKDEYIILDWEYEDEYEKNLFEDIEGQYANPFVLLERQKLIDELDEDEKIKLDYLIYQGFDFEEALERLDDVSYQYGTLDDVAWELLKDKYGKETIEDLSPYIDIMRFIRDLEIDGFVEKDGKVFFPF